MDELLRMVTEDKSIKAIYLHMQTSNEIGLTFYKKFGFHIDQTIENYYENITPPHCHLLKKCINKEE